MKRIIIIALAALVGISVSEAEMTVADASLSSQLFKKSKGEVKEVVYHASIHCNNCVKKIQENLAYEKGVKDLHICMDDQIIQLKYDAAKTNEETLKKAIVKLGVEVH